MLKYNIIKRTHCRLCGSNNLTQFMHFDSIPFFDEIVMHEMRGNEFSYPMELFFCTECLSVQTQHDVNLHQYYNSYQYVASNSPYIRSYMQSLVSKCQQWIHFNPGTKVIEVGAADGYLLSLFQKRGASVLGFEAASNLCQLATSINVKVINALFTEDTIDLIPLEFRKAHLLVLLHTFDHLPDPSNFMKNVRQILDPQKGVFLIEVHDLHDIYSKHETALFGHEHTTYLHYSSISRFLKRHGFRIIDFNFLPKEVCRGSSMLVAATPQYSHLVSTRDLSSFDNPALDKLSTFIEFRSEVLSSFAYLKKYVEEKRRSGVRLAAYGGWGRGVTTLAMAKLNNKHFEFVVDANSTLHGCYTPVSDIVIVCPHRVKRDYVDEVIVFNYAYIEEIRNTLSNFIKCGGKVISVIDLLNKSNRGLGSGLVF
ncbi:class I SAM-dependent methyltransferase [Desulfonatronovibrio magnus]|uniref:class I SAM-dependent methyltransferase n=1 Tax=Desulfonatronovibrio magnus TaxID=698827 RepID=UPI000A02C60A|nr:class I SAM-dependent methyltransferase [Desulfonatronovibrio magnus]